MSDRGAEGILRRRAEEKAASEPKTAAQPVDNGTAGHSEGRVKRAAKGAAGGSLAGPEGAALGAVTGLLSGGKGKSSSGHKALVAEFAVCMALLALSPLVNKGGDITVGKFMKKASATAAVFIILGFLASTGDVPKKFANGLGALMTLTVLLNERSVFGELVKAVGGQDVAIPAVGSPSTKPTFAGPAPAPAPALTPGGNPASLQDQLELGGGFAADAGTAVHNWFAGPTGPTGTIQSFENTLEAAPGDSIITKIFHGIFG